MPLLLMIIVQPYPQIEQEVVGERMVTVAASLACFKSAVRRTGSSGLAPKAQVLKPTVDLGGHLHCWQTWVSRRRQRPGQRWYGTCTSFQGPVDSSPPLLPPVPPSRLLLQEALPISLSESSHHYPPPPSQLEFPLA